MLKIIQFKMHHSTSMIQRTVVSTIDNTHIKCPMLLEQNCTDMNIKYIGRNMAVTSLKFLPPFRRPKKDEISKRSGGSPAVLDYCNNFILTLQGILNPY